MLEVFALPLARIARRGIFPIAACPMFKRELRTGSKYSFADSRERQAAVAALDGWDEVGQSGPKIKRCCVVLLVQWTIAASGQHASPDVSHAHCYLPLAAAVRDRDLVPCPWTNIRSFPQENFLGLRCFAVGEKHFCGPFFRRRRELSGLK